MPQRLTYHVLQYHIQVVFMFYDIDHLWAAGVWRQPVEDCSLASKSIPGIRTILGELGVAMRLLQHTPTKCLGVNGDMDRAACRSVQCGDNQVSAGGERRARR